MLLFKFTNLYEVRCAHNYGDVVNFTTVACRISSWLKWYKNYKNWLRLAKVIVKNKMSRFYGSLCIYLFRGLPTRLCVVDFGFFFSSRISAVPDSLFRESSMRCTWPNRSRLFLIVVSSTSFPVVFLAVVFLTRSFQVIFSILLRQMWW